jgi:hypothetical protein
MLKKLRVAEAKHVAEMARAARAARDEMLRHIGGEQLGEPEPARGEHNPAAGLGYDPLPRTHRVRTALADSVIALSSPARCELLALAWIGRGDYSANKWAEALAAASNLRDDVAVETLMGWPDLHEAVMKGLYELELA